MAPELTPELDKEIQATLSACWWRIELDKSIYELTPEIYVSCWIQAARAWLKRQEKKA